MKNHYGRKKYERRCFQKRCKRYVVVSGAILLLILFVWFYMQSSTMRAETIIVEADEGVNIDRLTHTLRAQAISSFPGNILGSTHRAAWDEATYINPTPDVRKAVITKSWKEKAIHVIAKKRETFVTWCDAVACYWTDEDGTAFAEAPISDGQFLTTVYDEERKAALQVGTAVLRPVAFSYLKDIITALRNEDLAIRSIQIKRATDEAEITLTGGTQMTTSLRFDPKKDVIPALTKLHNQKDITRFTYINFAVEGRIFYKQ